jgi:hypothetical protein
MHAHKLVGTILVNIYNTLDSRYTIYFNLLLWSILNPFIVRL